MSEDKNNKNLVDSVHERKSNASEWSQGSHNNSGSARSSDTVNSNIRNMTNMNRPSGHSAGTGSGGRSLNDRAKGQTENADEPVDTPSSAPTQRKSVNKQPNIGCYPKNCIGATICAVIIIAWILFLFLEEGGAGYFSSDPTLPPTRSWSPPTLDQCASIANGTWMDDDYGQPQERLWVNLEVQLSESLDNSNVTMIEIDWREKLQQHVMPTLAGCEPSSSLVNRRLISSSITTTSSLRRQTLSVFQTLPDYIISHAVIMDTILSRNDTITKQTPELDESTYYVYPMAMDILLWLQEESVDVYLLQDKVSQAFEDFLENSTRLEDLQMMGTAKLISVEENDATLPPAISAPVAPPTKGPSATLVPVAPPNMLMPSMAPSMAPSSVPTMTINVGNSTEPTPSPTWNVTGNVTESPSLSPSPTSSNQTST